MKKVKLNTFLLKLVLLCASARDMMVVCLSVSGNSNLIINGYRPVVGTPHLQSKYQKTRNLIGNTTLLIDARP